MTRFNFTRLIQKYSRTFTVITETAGYHDKKGDWVHGATTETMLTGAIMAMSERKVYNSNGVYTTKDKVLYMTKEIDNALIGAKVMFNGNTYSIEEAIGADDGVFTGVYNYTLKWVSAFEKGAVTDD